MTSHNNMADYGSQQTTAYGSAHNTVATPPAYDRDVMRESGLRAGGDYQREASAVTDQASRDVTSSSSSVAQSAVPCPGARDFSK